MPIILEAIIISVVMLLIFALAFVAIYLLAIMMLPVENGLSKMIWDAAKQKKPAMPPRKGSFRDFSSKH